MKRRTKFTWPHDSELAGLRDYRALLEPETSHRWSRWIAALMVIALLVGIAFLLTGCALAYPPGEGRNHLDAVHPSPERIAELADLNSTPKAALKITDAPWLRLSSPFVLAGNGVRLSCFVPRDTPNLRALQLGLLDDVGPVGAAGTHETNTFERLIDGVPCGSYLAVCNALGPSGRVLIHQEQKFTSRGSCNAGGDDR